jgi:ABC-2 type transport system ATP-binding protein
MTNAASGVIVEVEGLARSFRRKRALDGIDLHVTRGTVFGLVGENGAGKTTLVKHLLGSLRAKEGSVRVFGLDPVKHPVEVLSRIGYLSEDRDLPGWMKVRELMRYTQAFYPGWDTAYAEELRERFDLPEDARIKNLSRGEKAKAGLLMALAYRPELLLLDEPSSGLDPSARRHILEAIVRTVADEGRTVVFSSHLLDEVERVADVVAMIHEGRVVFQGALDAIKERHHRLVLRFEVPQAYSPQIDGTLHVEGSGHEFTLLCDGALDYVKLQAQHAGAAVVEQGVPSLEEIFLARVGKRGARAAS